MIYTSRVDCAPNCEPFWVCFSSRFGPILCNPLFTYILSSRFSCGTLRGYSEAHRLTILGRFCRFVECNSKNKSVMVHGMVIYSPFYKANKVSSSLVFNVRAAMKSVLRWPGAKHPPISGSMRTLNLPMKTDMLVSEQVCFNDYRRSCTFIGLQIYRYGAQG